MNRSLQELLDQNHADYLEARFQRLYALATKWEREQRNLRALIIGCHCAVVAVVVIAALMLPHLLPK